MMEMRWWNWVGVAMRGRYRCHRTHSRLWCRALAVLGGRLGHDGELIS